MILAFDGGDCRLRKIFSVHETWPQGSDSILRSGKFRGGSVFDPPNPRKVVGAYFISKKPYARRNGVLRENQIAEARCFARLRVRIGTR
jgi:hypothetical protein